MSQICVIVDLCIIEKPKQPNFSPISEDLGNYTVETRKKWTQCRTIDRVWSALAAVPVDAHLDMDRMIDGMMDASDNLFVIERYKGGFTVMVY